MKKSYIYIFLMILFASCIDIGSNPKFILENKTNASLDSIIIGASKDIPTILLNVKKNEIRKGEILFNEKIISDGDYFMEIYNENELLKLKKFGYYSNGLPLDKKFKIVIYKDSIGISYFK